MFFKSKPPKHNLPFQFFFHKESRFHPVCGRLLVSSHKHDLKNEVIDFSIVGLGKTTCMDVALINAIFEEARRAGFKPHALLYFSVSDHDIQRSFPDQHTGRYLKAKRLTADPTNIARVFVQVRDYRNAESEYSYGISVKQITDGKGDPFVTPEFVSLVFEYVKSQGLVPLDLLRVGENDMFDEGSNTVHDLPEYLFSRASAPVQFDDSQIKQREHAPEALLQNVSETPIFEPATTDSMVASFIDEQKATNASLTDPVHSEATDVDTPVTVGAFMPETPRSGSSSSPQVIRRRVVE